MLTGCIGGPVAGRLLRGDTDGAREQLTRLRDIVGPENCFVELMDHGIPAENRIRVRAAGPGPVRRGAAGRHQRLPLRPRRRRPRRTTCGCASGSRTPWSATGTGGGSPAPATTCAPREEMYRLFSGAEQACDNTLLIADMVDDRVLPEPRQRLPRFDVPAGFADAPAYLRQLVADGAARRYGDHACRTRSGPG